MHLRHVARARGRSRCALRQALRAQRRGGRADARPGRGRRCGGSRELPVPTKCGTDPAEEPVRSGAVGQPEHFASSTFLAITRAPSRPHGGSSTRRSAEAGSVPEDRTASTSSGGCSETWPACGPRSGPWSWSDRRAGPAPPVHGRGQLQRCLGHPQRHHCRHRQLLRLTGEPPDPDQRARLRRDHRYGG